MVGEWLWMLYQWTTNEIVLGNKFGSWEELQLMDELVLGNKFGSWE